MKHLTEKELIVYREGERTGRESVARHLGECAECRAALERMESVLAALDTMPVPDPGEDYGQRVWRQIAARLPERRTWDWSAWLEPRRLAAAGVMAAVIVAAFLAGRYVRPAKTSIPLDAAQVRERVLLVAVGDHLDRSEMILVELSNTEPNPRGKQTVDISAEQKRAEDLLGENRLYRQTALQQGDAVLASALDELERALLEIAHSPREVTPAQFDAIQRRIEARGILFKVRVVGNELRERQRNVKPAPAQSETGKQERNKA
ncbi:MAG: hypothetical protein AUI53_01475 [Acidobacteria bacterium 13_1_40CM_2_60_7]|nr:MAG: hypothetical protein AUI53_01475 [Acidobacteria bacterium 13_1_40CM_2_60_7]